MNFGDGLLGLPQEFSACGSTLGASYGIGSNFLFGLSALVGIEGSGDSSESDDEDAAPPSIGGSSGLQLSDSENAALQRAIQEGLVSANAPPNLIKGAIAEQIGWTSTLANGETGVQGPKNVSANGPDFITLTDQGELVVWDAKWSTAGKFPASVSQAQVTNWGPYVSKAVDSYSGPGRAEAEQALSQGDVRYQIFGYQP